MIPLYTKNQCSKFHVIRSSLVYTGHMAARTVDISTIRVRLSSYSVAQWANMKNIHPTVANGAQSKRCHITAKNYKKKLYRTI